MSGSEQMTCTGCYDGSLLAQHHTCGLLPGAPECDHPSTPVSGTTRDDFGYEVDVARFKDRPPQHIAEALLAARQYTAAGCHWALNVAAHLLVSPADPTREEAPEREPLMVPYSLPDHPCDCGGRVFHSAQTGQERCLSCGGRRYVSAPSASPVSSPLPRSGTAPGVCPQCRNALGRTPEGDAALCITDDCEAFLCVILPPAAVSREDGGDEDERLARAFHEAYERLAPLFGYETRPESAVPWERVPEQNRRLMIATCREVLTASRSPVSALEADAERLTDDEIRMAVMALNYCWGRLGWAEWDEDAGHEAAEKLSAILASRSAQQEVHATQPPTAGDPT